MVCVLHQNICILCMKHTGSCKQIYFFSTLVGYVCDLLMCKFFVSIPKPFDFFIHLLFLLSRLPYSPSELLQRWSRSHKIPVRGQKEFLPNDSVQQKACLQKTLEEHWMLVTEERVERM